MTATTKLTYALLAGAFFLACLSGYLIWDKASRLTATRDDLKQTTHELGVAKVQLAQIQGQIGELRSKMNQALAGTIYLVDSIEASQDFLAGQVDRARRLCGAEAQVENLVSNQISPGGDLESNLATESNDTELIDLCRDFASNAEWRRDANSVAIRRATATTAEEFDAIAADYQGLIRRAGDNPREAARIHEGLAYSRLRQGRIDEAVAAIRAATSLAPDLALPAMTSLKIDCRRRVEAAQVRAGLQDLRNRLVARAARLTASLRRGPRPADQRELRYIGVERRMAEQDPELYQLCAYAGVRPQG